MTNYYLYYSSYYIEKLIQQNVTKYCIKLFILCVSLPSIVQSKLNKSDIQISDTFSIPRGIGLDIPIPHVNTFSFQTKPAAKAFR